MYFTLEGNLTFAYTAGKPINDSQPTIIFVHGAANDHSVWTQQTRYFANHQWNALAIDLPGHGRSEGSPLDQISQMSSWVTRLISELNVPKAVVVGHSMGSLVALDLSARFSDITSGLVMIGTTFPMQVSDSLLKYSAKNDPRAYELINRFSISVNGHLGSNVNPGSSLSGSSYRLMQRSKANVLFSDFTACNTYMDGSTSAQKVVCPCLMILGKKDRMTPMKSARDLHSNLKARTKFSLVELPTGHSIMAESPNTLLEILKDFSRDILVVK